MGARPCGSRVSGRGERRQAAGVAAGVGRRGRADHCAESGRARAGLRQGLGFAGTRRIPAVAAGSGNAARRGRSRPSPVALGTGAGLRAGLSGGKRASPFPRLRRSTKLHAEALWFCFFFKKKGGGEDASFLAESRQAE